MKDSPIGIGRDEYQPGASGTLRSALLLAPALFLLGLFLYGIGQMALLSVMDENGFNLRLFQEFFRRPDYVASYWKTIEVALLVSVYSALIGYPVAYALWRYPGNRNPLMVLIILPWLVSVVVRTYAWMVILGPKGMINETLSWLGVIDAPLKLMFNVTGVVIGLVHVFLPFMVISVLSVLLHLDRRLEEASMSLGGNRLYTFFKVTLPLSLPGIISGVTLIYLMSIGAIVTPLLLGGMSERMLGTQIYQEVMMTFNFPKASTLAILLLLAGLAGIVPLQWLETRLTRRISRIHG